VIRAEFIFKLAQLADLVYSFLIIQLATIAGKAHYPIICPCIALSQLFTALPTEQERERGFAKKTLSQMDSLARKHME
jgi:hypothetical protein